MDFEHPSVRSLAAELHHPSNSLNTAKRCFHWVRDNIRHSSDCQDDEVTLSASDVLAHGTGLCYAKSHLLAAILRCNEIPCGFAYQRLALDESGSKFCLHGLSAVWLDGTGWYRIDPRGNRPDIHTEFDPPNERLAYTVDQPGETLYPQTFARPLPIVISTLKRYRTLEELNCNLPDWQA